MWPEQWGKKFMEPSGTTYSVFFSSYSYCAGNADWMEQNDKLVQQHGFSSTAKPTAIPHSALFSSLWSQSSAWGKAKEHQHLETSTSTIVQKQWLSVALCTVLTLLNNDQLWLPVIMACSLSLCMLEIAYCKLSTVTGFKSRVCRIHLVLSWGTCIKANVYVKGYWSKSNSRVIIWIKNNIQARSSLLL